MKDLITITFKTLKIILVVKLDTFLNLLTLFFLSYVSKNILLLILNNMVPTLYVYIYIFF